MNRLNHTALRRLSPRVTVITGAALGLVAGAAVYGSISSSAEVPKLVAFTVVKPPVVAAAPARASLAACAAGSKLEKGVCVVRVVRTVVVPSAAVAAAPSSPAGATAAGVKRASVAKPAAAAAPRGLQAEKPATSDTPSTRTDGEDTEATAQLSPRDAAALAARDTAAPRARSRVQND